jgi:hypothetical protein
MTMTIAVTHRHGCRIGTASMVAGEPVGSNWLRTSTLMVYSGDQLVAPLMTGLSIMPSWTPQFDAIVL